MTICGSSLAGSAGATTGRSVWSGRAAILSSGSAGASSRARRRRRSSRRHCTSSFQHGGFRSFGDGRRQRVGWAQTLRRAACIERARKKQSVRKYICARLHISIFETISRDISRSARNRDKHSWCLYKNIQGAHCLLLCALSSDLTASFAGVRGGGGLWNFYKNQHHCRGRILARY